MYVLRWCQDTNKWEIVEHGFVWNMWQLHILTLDPDSIVYCDHNHLSTSHQFLLFMELGKYINFKIMNIYRITKYTDLCKIINSKNIHIKINWNFNFINWIEIRNMVEKNKRKYIFGHINNIKRIFGYCSNWRCYV